MRLKEALTETVNANDLSGMHIGRYVVVAWDGHRLPAPISAVEHTKDYETVVKVAVPGGEVAMRMPFRNPIELVVSAQRHFW
jgi:hypothetical protein